MSEQVHYCRLPLPHDGGTEANLVQTQRAINEVLAYMMLNHIDPSVGQFIVTYQLDSSFERTSVVAEWRPLK